MTKWLYFTYISFITNSWVIKLYVHLSQDVPFIHLSSLLSLLHKGPFEKSRAASKTLHYVTHIHSGAVGPRNETHIFTQPHNSFFLELNTPADWCIFCLWNKGIYYSIVFHKYMINDVADSEREEQSTQRSSLGMLLEVVRRKRSPMCEMHSLFHTSLLKNFLERRESNH